MNPESQRREAPPRAIVGEWGVGILLAANLTWTTLGLGGYPAAVLSVTLALTALLAMLYCVGQGGTLRGRTLAGESLPVSPAHPATIWIWPFIIYAAANVIWISPVPWLGWLDWAKWMQVALILWVVANGLHHPGPRRLVFISLALIAVGSVVLACYQRFINPTWLMLGAVQTEQFVHRSSGPFGAPNSFAGLLLLLTPASAALAVRRRATAVERIAWGWVTVVLLLGLALTISRGAWLALAAVVVAAPLFLRPGGWVRRLRWASLVVVAVGAIGSVVVVSVPKASERFASLVHDGGERSRPILWRAAWKLFLANPGWGAGAGSFDVGFERHRPAGFVDAPEWAHNDYLNTLSDYGLVGAVLLGGGAVMAIRAHRRAEPATRRGISDWTQTRAFRSGLGLGLLAFALQLFVDLHLKIPALGLAAATVAGLALGRRDGNAVVVTPMRQRMLPWLAAVAVGLAGAAMSLQQRAEALRSEARGTLDRLAREDSPSAAEFGAMRAKLNRAAELAPSNGAIWADLADATLLLAAGSTGDREHLGRAAESAAERALRIAPSVFEFWVLRGLARNLQGRWVEAAEDFVQAITRAPANARPWFYYAEHLSRNPTQSALAAGALAFCLRLDPNCSQAIGLRQRLAIGAALP